MKTNLKLAKLWLDRKEYNRLSKVILLATRSVNISLIQCHPSHQLIQELYDATGTGTDGEEQSQKGTQLLEIYALEIQMHNETRNYKKLKVRASRLTS